MESKPSGRSDQLIQYNNHSWESHATHQAKYGSPGIFPVVHLSKKSIPIRSITPNKIAMHINLEESLLFNNSQCNETVEDLTNHHSNREICYENQEASNINSHNLLDALKEISRKRIHSENEDLDTHKSKQQRCCPVVTSSSNLTNSTVIVSKVPPVVNPITASLSSARTFVAYPRKSILKRKFYTLAAKAEQKHVLTQTDNALNKTDKHSSKISNNEPEHKEIIKTPEVCSSSPAPSALFASLFNDSHYEIAKKNKLAILLAPLTGKKPKLIPYNYTPIKTDERSQTQTKPASIISPKNKPKHDKHVTFAIPENEDIKEDTSIDNSKSDNISVTDTNNKSMGIPQELINEEKQSDPPQTSENNADSVFSANPPSIAYSSPEITFTNNESNKIPLMTTEKFFNNNNNNNNNIPATQMSSIGSIPSSNIPTSKIGGFKFDFKNNEAVSSPQIIRSVLPSSDTLKSQFSSAESTTNVNPQLLTSSSLTNMFSSGSSAPFSQVVDSFFNNESVLNPKSYVNAILDAKKDASITKFNPNASQFGANTTVTSIGKSMLLATGLGTSAVATNTSLPLSTSTSALSFGTTTSPKLNFDGSQTQQPFGSTFGMNTIKTSVSSPNLSTGFGSSDFMNQAPNFTSASMTNFNMIPSSNSTATGTGLSSTIFGSAPKPKTDNLFATTTTTGFNFNNSFTSPIFTNNQFKSTSAAPSFGDNKITFTESSAAKSSLFNTAISTQNNFFGTRNSNSMAGNFSGFETASSPQVNSLFTTSSAGLTQPQAEAFTKGSNMVSLPSSEVFSFGGQNNVSNNTGKFNMLDTNNLFSGVPNSAFGSAVSSTLQPSTNSYSFSSNVGFNMPTYNHGGGPIVENTTSRIFNIGSGSSYPKSRAQLKGRRRT